MQVTIREALDVDAPSLGKLSAEFAAHQLKPFDESRGQPHARNVLADYHGNDRQMIFVAEHHDGSIVAYISVSWVPFFLLQGTEAYVSELTVTASVRGCGVGSRLINHVEKEARKRGCVRMMLNNVRATECYERGFYAKRGFTERVGVGNFVKDLSQ